MDKKDKNGKNNGNNRIKVYLALILIVVVVIAIAGIIAYSDKKVDVNNLSENKTLGLNDTNNTTGPKAGYSLVKLAGFNFYAADKYLSNYNTGNYFDGFVGGKDYEKTLNAEDDFDRAFINTSQLIFIMDSGKKKVIEHTEDGKYYYYPNQKTFKIEVSFKSHYIWGLDELDIFDKTSKKNRTIEDRYIDGHNVKVVHTGKGFMSQSIGENETFVYFELKDKSILIESTGVPIDWYMIESFFKLN